MTLTVTMAVFFAGYIAACFVQGWLRLRERKQRRQHTRILAMHDAHIHRVYGNRNNVTRLHARGAEPPKAA